MAHLAINGAEPVRTAPFPVWPVWGDEEIQYLTEVIKSGQWGCLKGDRTAQFERSFAEYQDASFATAVNSGTTALKLALMAANVDTGDEVIVPAYTFIATATAVVEMGAVPIFVDIDPDTYNIDPEAVRNAITDKTRAIMPVHFAGRPADMDALIDIAKKHDLLIIEDAAQAWGSEWKGRRVGAIGDAGCFSFQSSKNINAGEGGIIVTNDETVAKFAASHSNCGRSEDGLWYEHFFFGGNYRITEFQSAVLQAQLERYDELKAIRQENLAYLDREIAKIDGLEPMVKDERITAHSAHLYIFRYKKDAFAGKPKSKFIDAMRREGIFTSPGYSIPLYKQPVFENLSFGPQGKRIEWPKDYSTDHCPETEKACHEEAIWFTQNVLLGGKEDMDDILAALQKIKQYADELPEA